MSRQIVEIRNGVKHGPVSSYVTSSNIASLNPFVLWDHFFIPQVEGTAGFGFHGHSGVATISYPQVGDIEHEDTGGHVGKLAAGGVQIMAAGSGVLHKETVHPENESADAFQLWAALPDDGQEMGAVKYSTSQKDALPIHHAKNGTMTKIIVGQFEGLYSPVKAPVKMSYLHVSLKDNSQWQYKAENGQTTAFIYVRTGKVETSATPISSGKLGIYQSNNELISVTSLDNNTEFLIITGSPLNQEVISNGASVHSSTENLVIGVQKINLLKNQMAKA